MPETEYGTQGPAKKPTPVSSRQTAEGGMSLLRGNQRGRWTNTDVPSMKGGCVPIDGSSP